MRGKKLRKSIIAIIATIGMFIILSNTQTAVAATQNSLNNEPIAKVADIFSAGKNFIEKGNDGKEDDVLNDSEQWVSEFKEIGQALVKVGAGVIIIVAMILGVQWVTASPDKQAKLKAQLIGFVVSIVVIFGAVGIWRVAVGIMKDVEF